MDACAQRFGRHYSGHGHDPTDTKQGPLLFAALLVQVEGALYVGYGTPYAHLADVTVDALRSGRRDKAWLALSLARRLVFFWIVVVILVPLGWGVIGDVVGVLFFFRLW